jgi:RNA polymerase sigma-70 factor, ECF subfamily
MAHNDTGLATVTHLPGDATAQESASTDEVTVLALRAAAGDQDALAGFVRATQADVWRLCAYLADRDHADDLTQDTYLRAIRSLPGYRAQAPVRSWLATIARRVVADHLTGRARHRTLFTDHPLPDHDTRPHPGGRTAPHDPAVPDHTGEHSLRALLAHLEPDRRAAFVLTQLLGYSYAETAQICAVPVGTIRSRVARARDDLLPHVTEHRRAG